MDQEGDIIFAPKASHEADSIRSTIVRLSDAKIQYGDIFDPESNSWDAFGTKMLSIRRPTSVVFDIAAKLVQHARLVQRLLLDELALLSLHIALSQRMKEYDQLQCVVIPTR